MSDVSGWRKIPYRTDGDDYVKAGFMIAPYCGRPAYGMPCPMRPDHSCQCDAKPDHERGQVEHHICQCGHAWTTQPNRPRPRGNPQRTHETAPSTEVDGA